MFMVYMYILFMVHIIHVYMEFDFFFQYTKKHAKGDVDRRSSQVFKFKGESLTLDLLKNNPESIEIVPDSAHPYKVSVVKNNSVIYLSFNKGINKS